MKRSIFITLFILVAFAAQAELVPVKVTDITQKSSDDFITTTIKMNVISSGCTNHENFEIVASWDDGKIEIAIEKRVVDYCEMLPFNQEVVITTQKIPQIEKNAVVIKNPFNIGIRH